ncbi:MAG: Yip1 family protein [Pseudomonadota bacterium]
MNLVRSVYYVLTEPRQEWQRIAQDNRSSQHVFALTIVPLTAFFLVLGLVFALLLRHFGPATEIETLSRDYLRMLIVTTVRAYGMGLVFIYVIARVMQGLSRRFGGLYSLPQALKLTIYSIVPLLIVRSLHILPFFRNERIMENLIAMAAINFLASIYSIYLLYLGSPVLLEVPAAKLKVFTLISAAVLMLFIWLPIIFVIFVASVIGGFR